MPDLGPHAGYILASYAVTAGILAVLVWNSVARYRSAKNRLSGPQDDRDV